MRFSRPLLALSISALSVLAISAAFFLGNHDSAQAQVPGCDGAPDNGIIARCLVVTKQTLPDGSPGSFSINAVIDPPAGANIVGSESLADGQSFGIPLGAQITPAGTVVTLTETVPAGWTLVSASCTGAGISSAPTANGVVVTYTGNLGNEPFAYAVCTFTNQQVPTSTPTATPTTGTATSTATPTATGTAATSTPTLTPTPIYYTGIDNNPNPGGLGGLFAPQPQPTRTAVPRQVPPQTNTPSTVRPPSTGDAGLR